MIDVLKSSTSGALFVDLTSVGSQPKPHVIFPHIFSQTGNTGNDFPANSKTLNHHKYRKNILMRELKLCRRKKEVEVSFSKEIFADSRVWKSLPEAEFGVNESFIFSNFVIMRAF